MTTCTLCPYPHFAKGYCQMHYRRWVRSGDPLVQGAKYQPRLADRTCSICGGPHHARGLCSMHFQRLKKHGDPLSHPRRIAPKKEMPMPAKHQPPMQPTLANLLTAYKAQGRGSISLEDTAYSRRVNLTLVAVKDRLTGHIAYAELRALVLTGPGVITAEWLRNMADRIGLVGEVVKVDLTTLVLQGQLTAKEEAA